MANENDNLKMILSIFNIGVLWKAGNIQWPIMAAKLIYGNNSMKTNTTMSMKTEIWKANNENNNVKMWPI